MIVKREPTGEVSVVKADRNLVEVLQDGLAIPEAERTVELGCMQEVVATLSAKQKPLIKEAIADDKVS